MRDAVGHRSQHAACARHASVANDDHLSILLACDSNQSFRWLPGPNVALALHADPGEPPLCSLDVMPGTGSILLPWTGRREQALRLLAIGAHHVDSGPEQLRNLAGAVDGALGSLRAIGPDDY